jgi:HEPN domain-containing protein
MDKEKQIKHWVNSANDDFVTIEILSAKKRKLHSLFFCHLAIEKALKANVIKATESLAPKTHKLSYLADLSNIEIDDDMNEFFGQLMIFQLNGRYPDYNPEIPDDKTYEQLLNKTKKVFRWLINQL